MLSLLKSHVLPIVVRSHNVKFVRTFFASPLSLEISASSPGQPAAVRAAVPAAPKAKKIAKKNTLELAKDAHYTYVGDLVDNKKHGQGKYIFDGGEVLEGEFRNNKFVNGSGVRVLKDGSVYEGTWVDGVMEGNGKYTNRNGTIHECLFVAGRINGHGRIMYKNGVLFEGEFHNGAGRKFGKVTGTEGNTYEGFMERGMYHGQGTYTYKSGANYEGEWKNGKRHGRGKETTAQGQSAEGEFSMGRMLNGHGVLRVADAGYTYEGTFVNGFLEGEAKLTRPNGTISRGMHVKGQLHGPGVVTYKDGSRYEGNFASGIKHGHGKLIKESTNELVEGEFRDGKLFNGEGSMSSFAGDTYQGKWVDGVHFGTVTDKDGVVRYTHDEDKEEGRKE